jgi:hypothetical protein
MAGTAREIASLYGPLKGRFLDALAAQAAGSADESSLRALITEFEAAKTRKDQLRYLPDRATREYRKNRPRGRRR